MKESKSRSKPDRNPIPDFPITEEEKNLIAAFSKANQWYVQDTFKVGGGEAPDLVADNACTFFPPHSFADDPVFETENPENIAVLHLRRDWLHQQIGYLDEHRRQVMAAELEGKSQAVVASEMSITRQRVDQLSKSAYKKIRTAGIRFYSANGTGLFGDFPPNTFPIPQPDARGSFHADNGGTNTLRDKLVANKPNLQKVDSLQEEDAKHYRHLRNKVLSQGAYLRELRRVAKEHSESRVVENAHLGDVGPVLAISKHERHARGAAGTMLGAFLEGEICNAERIRESSIKQAVESRALIMGGIPGIPRTNNVWDNRQG